MAFSEPLHPGCRVALARFTMTELDVARAIAAGDLTSPQRVGGFSLFALRITGTGTSYRSALDEHVYRPPEHYLTDDFLARCNGLPVIWEHPNKSGLDSKEFAKRAVGTIVLPYIEGDAVWGIAKIYDDEAASEMETKQLSTSPSVVFRPTDGNVKVEMEDGKALLIEGRPSLLDHLAVCENGVWDKGLAPSGVLNNTLEERSDAMAGETEAEKKAREEREDAARRDAGGNIDKVLAHLDAMSKRMDAMEMADAQRRRDAEREPWAKADAAQCAADDEAERKDAEEIEKGGEPKMVAADKARAKRRDAMAKRADAAKSDEDKKREDAEAAAKREDAARHDADTKALAARTAALTGDVQGLAARLANLPKAPTEADYAGFADVQARADSAAYQPLGQRAPGPLQGETLGAYRTRLARGVQQHSKSWKGIDLHVLQDAALAIAETQIYADAAVASRSTDGIPDDVLIPIKRTSDAGHSITEWRGRTTIFKKLAQPSMRVAAFNFGKGA